MNNLTDLNTVRALLSRYGIRLSKGMGQNFLINPSVCPRMAEHSGVQSDWGVIEIGPGIGVLTVELAKRAKRVVAIELDTRLEPVLAETLAGYDNVEVLWQDVLKTDLAALIEEKFADCAGVAVCANLPYYITSPIIMELLESRLPVDTITVMVQLEAAERMCAAVGTRAAGAVTVAVRYYSEPHILFRVSAGSFLPAPNVDSAVMRLDVRRDTELGTADEKHFFRVVKAGFSQRRKTLVNSISADRRFAKEDICAALDGMGVPHDARIEQLSMEQLEELARRLPES